MERLRAVLTICSCYAQGSIDLRSLKGKQQLLEAFAAHSAVSSDHRPSQLVYQVRTKEPDSIADGSGFCYAQIGVRSGTVLCHYKSICTSLQDTLVWAHHQPLPVFLSKFS